MTDLLDTVNGIARWLARGLLVAPGRLRGPCSADRSDLAVDDWGASVLQSMRCELPLIETIMRVM